MTPTYCYCTWDVFREGVGKPGDRQKARGEVARGDYGGDDAKLGDFASEGFGKGFGVRVEAGSKVRRLSAGRSAAIAWRGVKRASCS